MKSLKNILSILTVTSFVMVSCNSFLDQLPDQRTELNTPGKISELLVTAYPGANYITFMEAMSDNVTDNFGMGNVENINTDPYFWRDVQGINQDTPTFYWNNCYSAIAASNQALEAIELLGDGPAYSSQKGEALLTRAYSHFMLVSLFSKMYDPTTADTDLGIPYVLEPEKVVWKDYDRKTVAYVYEQIEKDLKEGIPLINDNNYEVPGYHFTRRAAHAFAARFYLFKGDYQKVIDHAEIAFPSNNYVNSMRAWTTTYKEWTAEALSLNYTKATESSNLLLAQTTSWWARRFRGYRYSTSNEIIYSVFGGSGRVNVIGTQMAYNVWSQSNLSFYVRKFSEHFVRTSINATTGRGYVMVPLFTTEEVLLSRAEAHAMLGNNEAALQDLNTFVSQRVVNYSPSNHSLTEQKVRSYYGTEDSKEAIVKAALDMRRAEFMHEGLRWFDILRHKIPVTHRTSTGETHVLAADDLRRVLQIPEDALQAGLELNPR
ncbi:RagB/SusD family nutrient uptake outer membrane protein [Belliella marina]|uniref:RagB/SusD family nutrient uptake outer membrane protein n=1 Tax=Belliella marina TaxID=1644146 RepID=A0ABW4VIM5_9BACT